MKACLVGTLYASHGARAVLGCFVLLGRDLILLRALKARLCAKASTNTDGANALAVVAAVAVRVDKAGIEERVVSAVAGVRIERTRPIAAEATCTVEARAAATTGSRQKYTVAITLAGYLSAFNAIHGCPCSGGVTAIVKFIELFKTRHLPTAAPVYCGSIVRWFEFGLVVNCAVLCHCII